MTYDSRTIELCKDIDETSADIIIESYVSEIAYNDSYIFAKHVLVPKELTEKVDLSNPEYYIVEVETEELYGPYNKEEFQQQCKQLKIKKLPEWVETTKLDHD